jgi:hypothetical protein
MLLQFIVETLDKELDRLQRLREVVVGLQRPSVLDLAASVEELPAPEPVQAEPRKGRPRAAREPRVRAVRARRATAPEPTALAGTIPTGPIVVSPKALAEQHSRRAVVERRPEPKPEPGSLGSMIRALHLDASS